MAASAAAGLLARVSARMWLASVGTWWRRIALALAAVYALALVTVRLLGLLPDVLHPLTLLAVPGAALAGALLLGRRASARAAGRAVDERARTKDLYLTAAALEGSVGEFQPLVTTDAEAKAGAIAPRGVVPFRWLPGVRDVGLAVGALLAGMLLLPQLDPFGADEVRKRDEGRRRELAETKKATELRKAVVRKEAAAASKEVERAVTDLKKTFRQMKPTQPKKNLERLMREQKELGRLWRKLGEEKLRDSLTETPMFQRFGRADAAKLEKWKKELEQGKADSLGKELAELKDMAKKLAGTSDPAKREKLRGEMKRRLREFAEFASSEANSRQLSESAKRALSQLEMAGMKGLSREALEGMAQSLELSRQELQRLAQRARELSSLEDALEASQLAKGANAGKGLDGEAAGNCSGMSDYASLYRSLMAGQGGKGRGKGDGTDGAGQGRGGNPPENPDQDTDFKKETSRSALSAGRMLMKWKVKGPAEKGEASRDYAAGLDRVKQSVSEALVKEQVPPAYHGAVKKYFDSLSPPEGGDAPGAEEGDEGGAGE
ncbi:MAG: hypothetical protein ACYS9X_00610 [Planctomycetota bacterium]|jgi:hypothetical protein